MDIVKSELFSGGRVMSFVRTAAGRLPRNGYKEVRRWEVYWNSADLHRLDLL